MFDHLKYIIVEERGCEIPVIFSPLLSHNEILVNHKIVSAGFCIIGHHNNVTTWGSSKTLNLGARLGDDKIIESMFDW